jgi:hypothetical protein
MYFSKFTIFDEYIDLKTRIKKNFKEFFFKFNFFSNFLKIIILET